MPKTDYCPLCECELVLGEHTLRMVCSNVYCDFADRRSGHSMLDPVKDRRGVIEGGWDHMNKWEFTK